MVVRPYVPYESKHVDFANESHLGNQRLTITSYLIKQF